MTFEVVFNDELGIPGSQSRTGQTDCMNQKVNVVIIEGPEGGSGEIQRGKGNDS